MSLPRQGQGGDRQQPPSRSISPSGRQRHHIHDHHDHRGLDSNWGMEQHPPSGPPEGIVAEAFATAGAGDRLLHVGEDSETTPLLAGEGSRTRAKTSRSRRRDDDDDNDERSRKPGHRRPSPLYLFPGAFLMAFAYGMTIAPKLEVYNQLVCRALVDAGASPSDSAPSNVTEPVLPPPVVSPQEIATDPAGLPLGPPPPFSWELVYSGPSDGRFNSTQEAIRASSEWSETCRRSPRVASAVAQLNTVLTLISGLLASLTAGAWGGLSDRRGRVLILCLALVGFLANDAVFLATVTWHQYLPYRFLALGPLIEGFLGGMAVASAAVSAYVSDCTPSGSRAPIFSTFFGVLMAGFAVGPTLGGLAVRLSGNVLAPFYVSALGHVTFAFLAAVALPESLGKGQAAEATAKEEERRLRQREQEAEEDRTASEGGWSLSRRLVLIHGKRVAVRMFGFLRPIGLLLPRRGGFQGVDIGSVGKAKRDWNLTFLATGYATYVFMIGIYGVKMQYAIFKFDFGPVENGYYLTMVGTSRVVALLVVIPLVIRLFKPKLAIPPPPPANEEEGADDGPTSEQDQEDERRARHIRLLHDSHFDLSLARYSMLVDMICFIALIFTSSLPSFLIPSALQALGGGASPAMQSLALSLAPAHHAGKVLASLSVLQSVMTSVLGPLIFGLLYAATVGTFPEAIFVLGAAVFATSSAFLLLVRLKKPVHPSTAPGQGGGDGAEEDRGRSHAPKQLRRRPSDADPLSNASPSAFVLRGRVHPDQDPQRRHPGPAPTTATI